MKIAQVNCPQCGKPLSWVKAEFTYSAAMECKECKVTYPVTISFTIEPLMTEPPHKTDKPAIRIDG